MTINQYALFQKDFKILFRHMLCALGIQVLLIVITSLLVSFSGIWFLESFRNMKVNEWMPKLQIAMTAITALIAAAYWSAEERAGGHDAFLKRLPISGLRLLSEKTMAGLGIAITITIVQIALYPLALLFGIRIWHVNDPVFLSLSATAILAYLIGLPISRLVKHPITVIVLGLIVLLLGMWEHFILLASFIAITGAGYWIGASGIRIEQGFSVHRSFWVLAIKQVREMILLILLSVVLLSVTLFIISQSHHSEIRSNGILLLSQSYHFGIYEKLICVISVILSIFTGLSTYQSSEKDGLRCMIYHYPISRNHLYWSKFLVGFIVACLLATCFSIVYTPTFFDTILNAPMKMMGETVQPSGMFNVIVFMLGLLPFCCAALITHSIKNPIYIFFETMLALTIVSVAYVYLQFYRYTYLIENNMFGLLYSDLSSTFPWILLFLIVGLSLAGWRAATDRSLLSGTTPARQIGVARLLFFTLATVAILVKTGWKDLLYLVTNINLGIG